MGAVYKERIRKFKLVDKPAIVPAKLALDLPNQKAINGWNVKWRDWQYIPQQDAMVGVWIAYPECLEGWCLYSAYPGACGPFMPNSIFNLSLQDWQSLPCTMSTPEDLEFYKAQCLDKLIELIDQVGAPPHDPFAAERTA